MLLDTQTGKVTDLGDAEHGPWSGIGATGNFMFNSTEQTLVYIRWRSQHKAMVAVRRDLGTGNTSETLVAKNPEPDAEYNFEVSSELKSVFYSVNPKEKSPERPSSSNSVHVRPGPLTKS